MLKLKESRNNNEILLQTIQKFDAAILFAQKEIIFLAPESSHAIKVAIDEALKCKFS